MQATSSNTLVTSHRGAIQPSPGRDPTREGFHPRGFAAWLVLLRGLFP